MLTIFSTAKPFNKHIATIQRNAIYSWTLLRPKCEIIIFGDEEGTAEIANEYGLQHIPDVECNEYGTPLLSSMFKLAENTSKSQLLCYINADIILLSDFSMAVQQTRKYKDRFLLIGQRWDVNLDQTWDFAKPDWELDLRAYVAKGGILHPSTGIDYFVFPRHLYCYIPPFAIGRSTWDNWLVYHACSLHIPVIDATRVITAIHQNHGQEHIPQYLREAYNRPDRIRNLELAGGSAHIFTLNDATHTLTPTGFERVLTKKYIHRYWHTFPVLYPRLAPFWKVVEALHRPRRTIQAIWHSFKTGS